MKSFECKWVQSENHAIQRPCAVCGTRTPYRLKTGVLWREAGAELMTYFHEWRCRDHAPLLHRKLCIDEKNRAKAEIEE